VTLADVLAMKLCQEEGFKFYVFMAVTMHTNDLLDGILCSLVISIGVLR
jgi:hypothetical protein